MTTGGPLSSPATTTVRGPSAISVIKRQLYDVPFQTLAEATIDANREMQIALKGSDFREGVASFVEKRPPRFTGK